MTVPSEIDEEPRTPGQYEEGAAAVSEFYGHIAHALHEAEAKMEADPTYFPTVTGNGWLSPADIDDLYERYPRPRPYDPEYEERTAAQEQANAEFRAQWEQEHPNAADGPDKAGDFDFSTLDEIPGDVEEPRHYPRPIPPSDEEQYLAELALNIGLPDDPSEAESMKAASLHVDEYLRAAALFEAEAKMAADPTYLLTLWDSVRFSPSDIDDLYERYPRPFAVTAKVQLIAALEQEDAEFNASYDYSMALRSAMEREEENIFGLRTPNERACAEQELGEAVDGYMRFRSTMAGSDAFAGSDEAADFDEAMVSADAGDAEAHYVAGVLHRTDGPAIVYPGGGEEWYLAGVLHRDDGPAVTTVDGSRYWYRGGDLHRTDGPAVCESDGTKAWYVAGKLHRTDGPALVTPEGSRWYIEGRHVPAHGRKMARARVDAPAPRATMPPVPDYSPDFDLESQYEDRSMEVDF